jgi:cytochrome d ubiquinol oxidase subunit II
LWAGSFDCITPFSLFTGVALLFGYGLLGAGWLILKTEGPLQEQAPPARAHLFPGNLRGRRYRQPVDAAGG